MKKSLILLVALFGIALSSSMASATVICTYIGDVDGDGDADWLRCDITNVDADSLNPGHNEMTCTIEDTCP